MHSYQRIYPAIHFIHNSLQLIKAQVRRARNYSITVNKPRHSA